MEWITNRLPELSDETSSHKFLVTIQKDWENTITNTVMATEYRAELMWYDYDKGCFVQEGHFGNRYFYGFEDRHKWNDIFIDTLIMWSKIIAWTPVTPYKEKE